MASSSANMSFSSQDSTSIPGIFPTDQSDFSLQLAQFLQQLGQTQMAWALQEYERAGRITDAQIDNFVNLAQSGADIANSALGRYNQTYAPLEDQYAREAQTYASDARMAREMGAAQSRTMQAHKQAQINAENELESFGIDPSSGRYQDLVSARNTEAASAAAAAGEAARVATEQEGDRRKMNAIAIGQRLPPQALNALNSAYQGVQGAARTALDRANTGNNLMTSASQFLTPAMRPLQPLQGQTTTSTGRGSSQGASVGGGGGGSGGGSRDPFNSDRFGRGSSAPPLPAYRGGPGPGGGYGMLPPPDAREIPNPYYQPDAGINDPWGGDGGWPSMFNDAGYNYDTSGYSDPFGADVSGVYQDNGWNNDLGWSNQGLDPQNYSYDNGGLPYYVGEQQPAQTDLSGWGDYSQPTPTDAWGSSPSGGSDPWANSGGGDTFDWSSYGDMGGGDGWSTPSYDTGGDWGGGGGSDTSWDTGGDWGGGDGWFAKGGPVGQRPLPRGNTPRGGGFVPPSMSPSRGQRTDDIPAVIPQSGGRAQINAGEFVLPRDVVAWKGQEFFQKMIQQARKARVGAPAKPTSKPSGGFHG